VIVNVVRVNTWKTRPASEMLTPSCTPFSVEAMHDSAPPTAWRTRETMSQGMKTQ
jgi:hypothetical protein